MGNYQWVKTDTASIMFSALTTGRWGRTFRLTAVMKENVQPDVLRQAAADVLPCYPNLRLSLRRGFFWTYQVITDRLPEIRPEAARPLLPITSRYKGLPDLRFVYGEKEISLEASHCVGDGRGILRTFEEVLSRYVYLQDGGNAPYVPFQPPEDSLENAFDTYYKKHGQRDTLRTERAFHFTEDYEPDFIRLLFADMDEMRILELAHARNMTVTEYLSAVLILGILQAAGAPVTQPVTIAVPVDLRRFFDTKSLRNFSIQSYITFDPRGRTDWTLDEICDATYGSLKQMLSPERLQLTLNKFGRLKNNPVLRAVPYALKRPVLVKSQNDAHASVTTIFTNIGDRPLPDALRDKIDRFRFINGDTRNYGLAVTVSCISVNGVLSLCFSRANRDTCWFDACVRLLREQGVTVEVSMTEGAAPPEKPEVKREKTPFTPEKLKAYFNI